MLVERFVLGPLDNNVYLVVDEERGEAALIDPGLESESLLEVIRQRGWTLRSVINTHAHFDHASADAYFQRETGAALLLHAEDLSLLQAMPQQASWFGLPAPAVPVPDRLLRDGDTVSIGGVTLSVLHTPGHSPGGICLLYQPAGGAAPTLFSGDTLFAGSIGRTDLPGGNHDALIDAIHDKLLGLPAETVVYPGHGPETTIGEERARNPFLVGI